MERNAWVFRSRPTREGPKFNASQSPARVPETLGRFGQKMPVFLHGNHRVIYSW